MEPVIRPEAPRGQIASVQVLRALAALTVVFGHAQHDALVTAGRVGLAFARNHLLPWGAGVDLFFVISGFIMVHASAGLFGRPGAARTFLRRRLIRIVPLYWLLASAYLVLSQSFGGAGERAPLAPAGILASYLFWPLDLFGDGHPRPFYTLGWTLNYEMAFYALFAAFIALPRHAAILGVAVMLGLGVIAGAMLDPAATPLWFWSRPIVLEFVAGMGIAMLHQGGFRLARPAALALIALAFLALILDPMGAATKPMDWITPNDWLRLAAWGLPMAALMAGIVLRRDATPALPGHAISRFWIGLGDASYALYLAHPFALVALRKLWLAAGLHATLGLWPLVALMIAGSIALAFAVHRLIEMPIATMLRPRPAYPSRPSTGNASSR